MSFTVREILCPFVMNINKPKMREILERIPTYVLRCFHIGVFDSKMNTKEVQTKDSDLIAEYSNRFLHPVPNKS